MYREEITCEKCGSTIIPVTLQMERDEARVKCEKQAQVIERVRAVTDPCKACGGDGLDGYMNQCMGASGNGCDGQGTKAELNELRTQAFHRETRIKGLKHDLAVVNARVSDLEKALANQCAVALQACEDLTLARAKIAKLESEIEGDNGLRASKEAGWALAQSRLKSLQAANSRVEELEQSVGQLVNDNNLWQAKWLGQKQRADEAEMREKCEYRNAELWAIMCKAAEAEVSTLQREVDHWAAEASAFDGQRMAEKARADKAESERDHELRNGPTAAEWKACHEAKVKAESEVERLYKIVKFDQQAVEEWRAAAEGQRDNALRSEAEVSDLRAQLNTIKNNDRCQGCDVLRSERYQKGSCPGGCFGDGAKYLGTEVGRLEAELKKERDRRVEHRQMNQALNEQVQGLQAANAELQRKNDNQAAALGLPRVQDAAEIHELKQSLTAARSLLSEWVNFDFDCPHEEYDEENDCYEEDGTALSKLYEDTTSFLSKDSLKFNPEAEAYLNKLEHEYGWNHSSEDAIKDLQNSLDSATKLLERSSTALASYSVAFTLIGDIDTFVSKCKGTAW